MCGDAPPTSGTTSDFQLSIILITVRQQITQMCVCVCMYLRFIGVLLHYRHVIYPSGWCVVFVVHPGASNSFSVTVVLNLVAPLKSNYLFGQAGKKVVPVGSAPAAPLKGSWASAPSSGAIHTPLHRLLTHELDYFPVCSQRYIPSPRLVCLVPLNKF